MTAPTPQAGTPHDDAAQAGTAQAGTPHDDAAQVGPPHASAPVPLVIDTDPGIDDAIAIALCLASPELDVRAVTAVGGNVGIDATSRNALDLLHLLGRDDVPVAAGSDVPLVRTDSRPDGDVHGAGGLGGVTLPRAPRGLDPRGAVGLIADVLRSAEDRVTILAIGPLTNIATLLATHAWAGERIERVVVMGGGVRVLGNVTSAAEFNIWYDPEAAQRVLTSGVEVLLVPLDATHEATLAPAHLAAIAEDNHVVSTLMAMNSHYVDIYRELRGTDETSQHDALAAAALLDPAVVRTVRARVDVECAGALTRGTTVADLRFHADRAPNATVALGADTARFRRVLLDRLATYRETA